MRRVVRFGNTLQDATLRHTLLLRPSARKTHLRLYSLLKTRALSPNIPSTSHTLPQKQSVQRAVYYSQDASSSSNPELRLISIEDPNRPGLFYHLMKPPTPISPVHPAYALSWLEVSPSHANSSTIIGWLPCTRSHDKSQFDIRETGLNDFKENRDFRRILHEVVKDGLQKNVDDIQRNGALQLQSGWMHVNDERNLPPVGRIGDPDDIVGSVLVEDSKILPETYMEMPSYRLCTDDGPIQLSPGLAGHLRTRLEHVDKEERSRSWSVS